MSKKKILDACCGGRCFWFQKEHPETLYVDIRREEKGLCPERENFCVQPDAIMDFRKLSFKDNTFKLIVWDPPHLLNLGEKSIMRKKYGTLTNDWRDDFRLGFKELWRVLDVNGTLIFKWCESDIPLKDVLALFSETPLFGHPTAKRGKTIWCVFFKSSLVEAKP